MSKDSKAESTMQTNVLGILLPISAECPVYIVYRPRSVLLDDKGEYLNHQKLTEKESGVQVQPLYRCLPRRKRSENLGGIPAGLVREGYARAECRRSSG